LIFNILIKNNFFNYKLVEKNLRHIVPWSKSNDHERLDVNNGLLLSPTYDALFDKYLITFDNKGKIQLSDQIEFDAFKKIGVSGKEQIDDLSIYNIHYLDRHNQIFK
jgi:predicted restriction endonuclease